MSQKTIITIIGARPQFIKCAPLTPPLDSQFNHILIHTGQHYDTAMSDIFFSDLAIRKPDINLDCRSGSHATQTSFMMTQLETIYQKKKPDLIIVFGDTNSTIAGSLAAAKSHIPILHIEAGLRSFDKKMPEEINRICTDHIATLLSCPTKNAVRNLKKEGITKNVFFHGDIMLDAQNHFLKKINLKKSLKIFSTLKIQAQPFALLTLHRPSNVDQKKSLTHIFEALKGYSLPIIFPVHPRTKQKIKEFSINVPNNIYCIDPSGYLDMLQLIYHSCLILTDSGGLQKEAFFSKTPCITLRNTTEWIETLSYKANQLVIDSKNILNKEKLATALKTKPRFSNNTNPFGTGKATQEIVKTIENFLA